MSSAYWCQYDHSEIMSIHGVDFVNCSDDEIQLDTYDCCKNEDHNICQNCEGYGCESCIKFHW